MKKKYVVRLDKAERIELESIVSRLSGSSQKVRRANILLQTFWFQFNFVTVPKRSGGNSAGREKGVSDGLKDR